MQNKWADSPKYPLTYKKQSNIHTVFLFQKKKGSEELMASHPDVIHSGLVKINHYCEDAIDIDRGTVEKTLWRDFCIWQFIDV